VLNAKLLKQRGRLKPKVCSFLVLFSPMFIKQNFTLAKAQEAEAKKKAQLAKRG
jgi:hypothetical protein